MKHPSQCDRVWAVLQDGRVHTIEEIHERAGTMRLNSRVSELRSKRGVRIDHWVERGHHVYKLAGPVPSGSDASQPIGPANPSVAVERGSSPGTHQAGKRRVADAGATATVNVPVSAERADASQGAPGATALADTGRLFDLPKGAYS